SGSIGASICIFISGFLGEHIDKKVPIIVGPIFCLIIIVLVFISYLKNNKLLSK
ncbi:MFS transporter, partial [Francisella tularensis subsp. holarctica]|nr:MFS transporter [Francisella tularensis subsp. holarctica]